MIDRSLPVSGPVIVGRSPISPIVLSTPVDVFAIRVAQEVTVVPSAEAFDVHASAYPMLTPPSPVILAMYHGAESLQGAGRRSGPHVGLLCGECRAGAGAGRPGYLVNQALAEIHTYRDPLACECHFGSAGGAIHLHHRRSIHHMHHTRRVSSRLGHDVCSFAAPAATIKA